MATFIIRRCQTYFSEHPISEEIKCSKHEHTICKQEDRSIEIFECDRCQIVGNKHVCENDWHHVVLEENEEDQDITAQEERYKNMKRYFNCWDSDDEVFYDDRAEVYVEGNS